MAPKTSATFWVRWIANPPIKEPIGVAEKASSPATLRTLPSMLLGTIACRRLNVLMLSRLPKPLCSR